jgi:hypothetical protein
MIRHPSQINSKIRFGGVELAWDYLMKQELCAKCGHVRRRWAEIIGDENSRYFAFGCDDKKIDASRVLSLLSSRSARLKFGIEPAK